jgi:hypothetical protein
MLQFISEKRSEKVIQSQSFVIRNARVHLDVKWIRRNKRKDNQVDQFETVAVK